MNEKSITSKQLFAYVFNELDQVDNELVEDIILEDDVYAVQVDHLILYCQEHKIYTSRELEQHLELKKHDFLHQMVQEEKDLPKELIEKYQAPPKSTKDTPLPLNSTKPENKTIRLPNWILVFFALAILALVYLWMVNSSSNDNQTNPDSSTTINNSQEDLENQKIDSSQDTPFNHTIPTHEEEKEDAPINNLPGKKDNSSSSKEELAANDILPTFKNDFPDIITTMDLEIDQIVPLRKIRGSNDRLISIDSLRQRYLKGENLNEYGHLELGFLFLKENDFENAITNFEASNASQNIPQADWYILQTYILQNTPSSIRSAKLHFQEKYIKNISDVPPVIKVEKIEKMSTKLREALLSN